MSQAFDPHDAKHAQNVYNELLKAQKQLHKAHSEYQSLQNSSNTEIQRLQGALIAQNHIQAPTSRIPLPAVLSDKVSIEEWLFHWEVYFEELKISQDAQKIRLISMRLSGPHLKWFRRRQGNAQLRLSTGAELLNELQRQFEPVGDTQNARAELVTLKQQGSLETYSYKFRSLAFRIPDLSDADLTDRFIRGLSRKLQPEVYLRDPATLDDAIRLASRLHHLFHRSTPLTLPPTQRHPVQPTPSMTMDLDAVSMTRTRLTDQERDRLRRLGACFYCRQVGHMKNHCPKRVPKESLNGSLQ